MSSTSCNGAVLTAHEATIQTAQVEIQVLKVGKKQVTMGMFRQLPYKSILDWPGIYDAHRLGFWDSVFPTERFRGAPPFRLAGRPWGHVNYFWAENVAENKAYFDSTRLLQRERGEILHLVWQDGAGLYRDIVYSQAPTAGIFTWRFPDPPYHIPLAAPRRDELEAWCVRTYWSLAAFPQLFVAV
jgi:hypothetical protein